VLSTGKKKNDEGSYDDLINLLCRNLRGGSEGSRGNLQSTSYLGWLSSRLLAVESGSVIAFDNLLDLCSLRSLI
jgi:hypothetical protein